MAEQMFTQREKTLHTKGSFYIAEIFLLNDAMAYADTFIDKLQGYSIDTEAMIR